MSCRGARRGERLTFSLPRLTQSPLQSLHNEMIVQTDLSRHSVRPMHPRIVGRPPRRTPVYTRWAFHKNAIQQRPTRRAFTLIELLVVIAIIAILIGLLFPAFKAVQNQARQVQAKNDLTQLVNAVNAFYTDYGKYPLATGTADTTYGSVTIPNSNVLYTLRADPTTANGNPNANNAVNTRQIVFISPPYVKNDTAGNTRSGVSPTDGNYYGPWGSQYQLTIDGNYNNQIANPYTANTGAGPATLNIGVIAWSLGSDATQGTDFNASDDVISWQ